MAQIFVSHSSQDKETVALLGRAFASTNVKGVFEEYEAILKAITGKAADDAER